LNQKKYLEGSHNLRSQRIKLLSSPNHLYQALNSVSKHILVPDQIITWNDHSPTNLEIAEYKGRVLEKDAGTLQKFFLDCR